MNRQDILTALLLDDSFRAWVSSGGKENSLYWQNWMTIQPHAAEIIHEASEILLELQENKIHLSKDRKDMLRQRIISIAQSDPSTYTHPINSPAKSRLVKIWSVVAAAFIVLIALSALLYQSDWNQSEQMQYATAYGEIKTITLPDSSQVILNGNSSIRYSYQKNGVSQPREVWLEGEGFFAVRKREMPSDNGNLQPVRFIVHTENLSIQVLGTRFNVRHRRKQTQVVLEEGSIQLDLKEQPNPLLMSPDELVEVNKGEKQIHQKLVKTNEYTAWKEGLINFEGASFVEISRILEDNYDLELDFKDKQQAKDMNLKGSFPASNIDILLEAIANVTHTSMTKKGKTIVYQ